MNDIEVNLGSFAREIQARLEAGEKEIGDLKQYIIGLRGSLNREEYKGINVERAARVIAERRLLDARNQIRDLIGADRPGPNSHCTDCGRAMIWTSERGESWICPYHVWWRMKRAEEQIAATRAARAARGGGDE